MTREVWFQLMWGDGNAVTDRVKELADSANVADLRDAVFSKMSPVLPKEFVAAFLIVLENRAAYDAKQAFEEDSPIGPLGGSKQDALIVQVPTQRRVETDEEPAFKKPKTSTVIKDELMMSIGHSLDIDTWQVGDIALDICRIESDFPEWFYVRKDIIKVFETLTEAKLNVVFVGTPGVGKSMLVVMFAFYLALLQKKRVALFRKQKGIGFSMLYLDAENKRYWRMEEAAIGDIGFLKIEILICVWTDSHLSAVGAHVRWTEQQIKDRYFYSGGNLRDFLSEIYIVESSIDQAVKSIELADAVLLNTQYGGTSERQVDRLRMTGIRANDHRDLNKFLYNKHWVCVITSEYALRQLGNIVKPSYYEELWSKGRMLGDDGLMGIAFENYVHTLAGDGMKIELQVRAYDQVKARQHTYVALEFEAKSCRNDGIDATECDAAMKRLASSSDDYWYPSRRSLETIDCVAKLKMSGQPNMVGLIQITKSGNHTIDSNAVDKYAGFFPNGSKYIALVPNKETCDRFRLAPASLDTKVSLDVAYMTTWCCDGLQRSRLMCV